MAFTATACHGCDGRVAAIVNRPGELADCDVARRLQIPPRMKTNRSSKLVLNRETLRCLTGDQLSRARGGRRLTDVTVTCPSVDICPSLDDLQIKCKPPIVA